MNLIDKLFLLVTLSNVYSVQNSLFSDSFDEELTIKQLQSGHVYSIFEFITSWNVNIFEQPMPAHYNIFPKSLGEIISKFGISELHFSMTQGRWRYNKWGYPILSAPTGIELWVWFHPDLDKQSVDENWAGLVHALSGQFCSSVNFISTAETTSPEFAFKPLGLWPTNNVTHQTHLRYATLPKETVCTENLTPWKKLLPCGGKAGLSSLLNAIKLYDSSYHSLAVHVTSKPQGGDDTDPILELKQTISSVFDPYHRAFHGGWKLEDLFGEKVKGRCPIASTSQITIHQDNINMESLNPSPSFTGTVNIAGKERQTAVYSLVNKEITFPFDVHVGIDLNKENDVTPFVLVHKYTTGYGEEYGGSTCVIQNTHPDRNVTVSYLDIVPYFLRLYVHMLQIDINGQKVTPERLKYSPAYYRERPARLEFVITLQARSTARISIEFEKVFQDWMQHPPDAHHGFYIGSSVISGFIPKNGQFVTSRSKKTDSDSYFQRIYSEPLLIRVPLPDFSMPYNVICLTCTVIAIAFGSVYNLTTRTFQVEEVIQKKTIKERITNFLTSKLGENTKVEEKPKVD